MTSKLLDAYTPEEVAKMDDVQKFAAYKTLLNEEGLDDDEIKVKNLKRVDTHNIQTNAKRKTQAQRNQAERAKEQAKQESLDKKQKKLDKSVGQVPNLLRELEKEEKEREEKKAYVKSLKAEELE